MPQTYKILSFNVCTDVPPEEGYAKDALPEWRAQARLPLLKRTLDRIILEDSPDIIQFQEGRQFITQFGDKVDSVTELADYLAANGYDVITAKYNPTDRAFVFTTAYKRKVFANQPQPSLYFTKTPDHATLRPDYKDKSEAEVKAITAQIKEHNYGEEFERSAFINKLIDKTNGNVIYCFNVHFGLSLLNRIMCAEILVDFVQNIVRREPEAKIIIAGDYNTFPTDGGPKQLEILKKSGILHDATENIFLPDGQAINFSFIYFPYDFGIRKDGQELRQQLAKIASPDERMALMLEYYKTKGTAIGGALDHVLYHGFAKAITFLKPIAMFPDMAKTYTEATVKEYVARHLTGAEKGPAFASDHQPMITTLTMTDSLQETVNPTDASVNQVKDSKIKPGL